MTQSPVNALRLDDSDNVVTALFDLRAGNEVRTASGVEVVCKTEIKRGHKVSVQTILEGGAVVKYSYPIAHASRVIEPGEHVHSHNVKLEHL
ncbi:MAG: UxaA family hydrolase [Parvibaculum sp.]|nr:UxaA family hydrolase [Parvibaculum sp.]